MTGHRIIIDTDPGVDDAAAILMALASPEIDVLGITTVAGNVPLNAALANACRIVGIAGRPDVPVMAGAQDPLLRDQVLGKYALIGAFPERLVGRGAVEPAAERAAGFIARQAREAARTGCAITICAIGPLTNIALALRLHPEVSQGIARIVCMGGAFTALGHRVPWAEFNIYADPHAAQIVFSSDVPVVLFPLDVTMQALFDAAHVAHIRDTGGEAGTALANLLSEYDRSDPVRYGRPGGPLHDPMTIAWLIAPDLFEGRRATIGVQVDGQTSGHTYADFTDHDARTTVMRQVDEAGYITLLTERLTHYGTVAALSHRGSKGK